MCMKPVFNQDLNAFQYFLIQYYTFKNIFYIVLSLTRQIIEYMIFRFYLYAFLYLIDYEEWT